jgi:uncharacterized DUF497 family protein
LTPEKANGSEQILSGRSVLRKWGALFDSEHIIDRRSDDPEQFRAMGWVNQTLYSVIYEVRRDADGEFYHLVNLWKATREERQAYEENI